MQFMELEDMDFVDELTAITQELKPHQDEANPTSICMELDTSTLRSELLEPQGNESFLIIDTNFILSHSILLDQLKDLGTEYHLTIIIPQEVMRELDGLKNSTKLELQDGSSSPRNVGKLARQANSWIYYCLAESVRSVKAQGPMECISTLSCNDEAILDCSLYFQKKHPLALTVLFSDDKNLCMKALLNKVPTVSYRAEMTARVIAETIYSENVGRFGNLSGRKIVREVEVSIPGATLPLKLDTAVETVYKEVEQLVISIVTQAIAEAYGSEVQLLKDYRESDVNSLCRAEAAMIRFWQPLFGDFLRGVRPFGRNGNQRVPKLYEYPNSRLQLTSFIQNWSVVLHKLYEKLMPEEQLRSLSILAKRWVQLSECP